MMRPDSDTWFPIWRSSNPFLTGAIFFFSRILQVLVATRVVRRFLSDDCTRVLPSRRMIGEFQLCTKALKDDFVVRHQRRVPSLENELRLETPIALSLQTWCFTCRLSTRGQTQDTSASIYVPRDSVSSLRQYQRLEKSVSDISYLFLYFHSLPTEKTPKPQDISQHRKNFFPIGVDSVLQMKVPFFVIPNVCVLGAPHHGIWWSPLRSSCRKKWTHHRNCGL